MGRAAVGRAGARIVGAAAEDQWSAAGGWGKLLFLISMIWLIFDNLYAR